MDLFDSGPLGAGGTFSFTFHAAGTYSVIDTATGTKSFVRVPLRLSPNSGGPDTVFTMYFSNQDAPSPFVYDLEVKAKGDPSYQLNGTGFISRGGADTGLAQQFGPGTFSFRSRLRKSGTRTWSGWSPARTVTFTA
jgi:hypothetical protein